MAKAKQEKENKQDQQRSQDRQHNFEQDDRSETGMTRNSMGSGGQRGLQRREQSGSPFTFMRRFSEEMDRLFDDFGFGSSMGRMTPFGGLGREFEQMSRWSPQTEILERDNEIVIRADLPGMSKDDIDVEMDENRIVIQGERRDERGPDERGFSERSYGSFYRSIPLPEGVDGEQARADFRDGTLEITLPQPEQRQQRRRRLEIGSGQQSGGEQTPRSRAKGAGR